LPNLEIEPLDADTPPAAGTIDELLANSVAALKTEDQTDVALLDILQKNILTLLPASDAVKQTVNEIEALAALRGEADESSVD